MQISKRVKSNSRQKAQNLIEFVLVFPMLIFLILGIFEVALYWQNINAVYALNDEINANTALVTFNNLAVGAECPAATKALAELELKDAMISMNNPTYTKEIVTGTGNEPFAFYKYTSTNQVAGKPQATLLVDCRNPFENGVMTQIEFYHKTLIMKASIPRFDSPDPIIIIPDNVFITSPKLNTIRHY